MHKNKQKIFEKVYKLGFGVENDTHTVQSLFIQINEEKKPIAMYTGYELNKKTFYLQFAARLNKDTNVIYDEWLDFINKKYRYMVFFTSNENFATLITNLKFGFKIIGVRRSIVNNEIFIEMYKDLGENQCQNI